ncbi:Malonyl CoA-acyl carrier protein transacylase [Legionella lansingensis]|uniref:Phthiocerol/phthiodiolone dimycocerosyl transferase n=1 Tax=Legionella lansingensis TaxID=45067 RepID=A0A0W0W033_9GAMM|nr:hypothetical protein [Legionella lansingensis]KTD25781.1 acyltransferase PapA5 [Legionella lansingensis]SNV52132.1 Malonyl CoA-acyl carrier protein transacylase [Legionella lansingensis]
MQKRKLGYWEALCQSGNDIFHGNGLIAAVAKFYHPQLDLKRFRQALALCQASQPLLRARIKKGAKAEQFIIDPPGATYLPFQVVGRRSDFLWESIIELELNRPPRNQDYQWRSMLLYDDTEPHYEFILIAGHNIGDGLSIAYFFDSCFKIYQDLNPIQEHPFYPPVEELLTHMDNQKTVPPSDFDATPIYYQATVPLGERVTRNLYHTFTAEQTHSLMTHCKNRGFSVNAFVNAATLLSLVKTLNQNLSTTLHTPINLRKWCQPEMPNDFFGCYVSVVTTYHPNVTVLSDINVLASNYEHQLKNVRLPGDAIFPCKYDKEDIIKAAALWKGSIDRFSMGPTVTNIGLLPFNNRYGELEWSECYFCTSRQNADIPILLNVLTLNKRLMIAFTYTEPMLDESFMRTYVNQFIPLLRIKTGTK